MTELPDVPERAPAAAEAAPGSTAKDQSGAAEEADASTWSGPGLFPPLPKPVPARLASVAARLFSPDGGTPTDQPPELPEFEILETLGQGGMGVVYKARQRNLNRLVALKMILAGAHATPAARARFRAEGEAVARLQHPNIVQLYEVGEHAHLPYFVLEYVDGDTLSKKLHGTPQPAGEAARLVETLARAVHFAHQHGVVHRDLKPSNVLLTPDGVPKITDFGLAKQFGVEVSQADEEKVTHTGAVIGTPSYMAPEQVAGEVNPGVDVYALGATLYELLTGRPPFRGVTPLETLHLVQTAEPVAPMRLQPTVPRDVQTICMKCLEKQPGRRYASAAELAEDLRRYQAHRPVLARPASLWDRGWKWARRQPAAAALVFLAVLSGAALLGGGWWYTDRLEEAAERQKLLATAARIDRDEARRQQALAVTHRRQAELALQFSDQFAGRAVGYLIKGLGKQRVRSDILQPTLGDFETLIEQAPAGPEGRYLRAWARRNMGAIYRSLREFDLADEAYGEALALFRGLAQDAADEPVYVQAVLRTLNPYGMVLREMSSESSPQRLTEAVAVHEEAVQLGERLVKLCPEVHEYRSDLGASLHNLANAYSEQRRFPEALALLDQAIGHQAAALHAHPRHPVYDDFLYKHLHRRAWTNIDAGRHAEASRAAQDLVTRFPGLPKARYEAACCNAAGVQLLSKSSTLSDEARTQARRRYTEQALGFLEQLAKEGQLDVQQMEQDSALVIIRSEPRYQQLVKAAATTKQ